MKKLPGLIALQIAIFFYFYVMGMCLTNEINITKWSQIARVVYIYLSVLTSFGGCLIYALNDNNNERK
jgi:hypothetical protein